MSPNTRVKTFAADPDQAAPFGPAFLEHRTAHSGLTKLGTYVMTFPEGGQCDAWTLQYEESIYVAKGTASVSVIGDAGETHVSAGPGQVITISKGSTVRYGATPESELVLSISPVNWRQAHSDDTTDDRAEIPRILFLTPFHFEERDNDSHFDAVVTDLLEPRVASTVVADHVGYFESDDVDFDEAQTEAVVSAVQAANDEGYDAIVIACHYDPAIAEARAVSRVPIVAPLQLTAGAAIQHGPKFAVITDVEEAEPVIKGLVAGYGYEDACAGVTAIGWDGDAILRDTLGAATAVDRLVERIATDGGVQSIVIGCTIVSAAYETHRDKFPDRGPVVLNSNLLTVKGAAALAAN